MGTSISHEDKVTGFQLKKNSMIFDGYYSSIYSWHEDDLTMISTLCLSEGGNALSRNPYANIVWTLLSPCQHCLGIPSLTQSLSWSLHDYSIHHSHCDICSWHTHGWKDTMRDSMNTKRNHIFSAYKHSHYEIYSWHTNAVIVRYILNILADAASDYLYIVTMMIIMIMKKIRWRSQ